MRLQPAAACRVIVCCAVLHNIAIAHNDLPDDVELPDNDPNLPDENDAPNGTAVRAMLTNTYF